MCEVKKPKHLEEITALGLSHLLPVNTWHLESRQAGPDPCHYDYRRVSDACHRAHCPQDHRRAGHRNLSAVLQRVALATYYSPEKKICTLPWLGCQIWHPIMSWLWMGFSGGASLRGCLNTQACSCLSTGRGNTVLELEQWMSTFKAA